VGDHEILKTISGKLNSVVTRNGKVKVEKRFFMARRLSNTAQGRRQSVDIQTKNGLQLSTVMRLAEET
jgi:hypothetical protein